MGSLIALAVRLCSAAQARHATRPKAVGEAPLPADDAAELEHEAAELQAARNAEAARKYPSLPETYYRRALVGLIRAALMRPPAWADTAARPTPGAWCSCCRRSPPATGGRWQQ